MIRGVVKECWSTLSKRRQFLSSDAYNRETCKEYLSKLKGGSVDLTKDEKTGIATILLNNPERKNAFTGKMMVDLSDVVTDLEQWPSGRGVLVCGSNHTFCSGGDLTQIKHFLDPVNGGNVSNYMQDTLTRLFRLPLVTLAVIEGRALGGGAELACACDFRAMSTSAVFGFVQAKLAVSPGWGGGSRLVEILGRSKALRLLASGAILNSDEAKQIGLADVVVLDGTSAVKEAQAFLRTITVESPAAAQAAKKVVVNASTLDVETVLEREREIFISVWGSPAHLQALKGGTKFTKNNEK